MNLFISHPVIYSLHLPIPVKHKYKPMLQPTLKAQLPPVYPFDYPLLHQFVEFVYFDGLFTPIDINRINQYWDSTKSEQATVTGDEIYNEQLRKSSVIGLPPDGEHQWAFDRLGMLCLQCNQQRFNFDLRGFYENLQLAEYGEGDFFDWHLDFGFGASSVRKLSITVQLSKEDSYEGGDLQFMINQNIVNAPRKQGTVVVFPSFILHRVTPITKGKRRSIVGWVGGPPYR